MELNANNYFDKSHFGILRSKRAPVHRHLKVASILAGVRLELAQELESPKYLSSSWSNYYETQIKDENSGEQLLAPKNLYVHFLLFRLKCWLSKRTRKASAINTCRLLMWALGEMAKWKWSMAKYILVQWNSHQLLTIMKDLISISWLSFILTKKE